MLNMHFDVDHKTHTLTFKRRMAATCEQIFEAWTNVEHMKQWWDPTGVPLAECTIDLRLGGTFRFVNQSHHGPPFVGAYREIDRPHRLVFEAMGALGTVLLVEQNGGSHMTVTIQCGSDEHFNMFVKLGVADGTARTLDNLVEHMQRKGQLSPMHA